MIKINADLDRAQYNRVLTSKDELCLYADNLAKANGILKDSRDQSLSDEIRTQKFTDLNNITTVEACKMRRVIMCIAALAAIGLAAYVIGHHCFGLDQTNTLLARSILPYACGGAVLITLGTLVFHIYKVRKYRLERDILCNDHILRIKEMLFQHVQTIKTNLKGIKVESDEKQGASIIVSENYRDNVVKAFTLTVINNFAQMFVDFDKAKTSLESNASTNAIPPLLKLSVVQDQIRTLEEQIAAIQRTPQLI